MIGCSLYRFYDAEDRLLYVGITSVGPSRWIEHEDHRAWWALTSRTTVEHFASRPEASAAERRAIQAEHPIHNVAHQVPLRSHSAERVKRRHGTGGMTLKSDGRWAVNVFMNGRKRYWSIRDEAAARLMLAAVEGRNLPRADRERAIALLQEMP